MLKSTLLSLFILLSIALSAQVIEKEMEMSAGELQGLQADLTVDAKRAEKIWKEYVKPYGKVDFDNKNKEYVLFNVVVDKISSEPISIVSKFHNAAEASNAKFWIKNGDSYVSSESDADLVRNAGAFYQEYAYECERWLVGEEVKREDKKLKDLNKDLKRLEKKNANWHKDITKKKKNIADWEHEQALNEQALTDLEAGDTSGDDYEKELKKLRKKKEKYINDIANGKKKIIDWENDLSDNEKDQKSKREEIQQQEQTLKEVRKKFTNIGK